MKDNYDVIDTTFQSKPNESLQQMISREVVLRTDEISKWRQASITSSTGKKYLFGIAKKGESGDYSLAVTKVENNGRYSGLWLMGLGTHQKTFSFPPATHIFSQLTNPIIIRGSFNVFYKNSSDEVAYAKLILANGNSIVSRPYKNILIFIADGENLAAVPTAILAFSNKNQMIYSEMIGRPENRIYISSKRRQTIKLGWL